MLVPLTDSTNPYTAMMLELIANDRRYPASRYPRERHRAAPVERCDRAGGEGRTSGANPPGRKVGQPPTSGGWIR